MQNIHRNASMKKPFTLIELLVVVAIIGILMSMLMPSLQKARFAAKNAVCINNLKQIGYGLFMHINDNGGNMPPRAQGGKDSWSGGWGNWIGRTWDEYAYEQMTGSLSWGLDSQTPDEVNLNVFKCPLDENSGWNGKQRRSYSFNNGRGKGVDGNAKTSEFHLQPFNVGGIRAAYAGGEDSLQVMVTDNFYSDGSADGTMGFNGGSMGSWWGFRLNPGKHHPDLGRNGLTYSGSVKHFKRLALTSDAQIRTYFDYEFPSTP